MAIQSRSKLMWFTFSKRQRQFFTLLVVVILACIIYKAYFHIYSRMLNNVYQWTVSQAARRGKYNSTDGEVAHGEAFSRFPNFSYEDYYDAENSYGQRHGRHDIQSINLQMWQLNKEKSFFDPRLAPINFTIVPNASLCSEVRLVVVVHVRAEDAPSRNYWRNTYGDPDLKNQSNYNILFSIGKPSTLSDQEKIEEEAAECGDILQTDYKDAYRNLTLKHLAELRYLTMACPKNVVVLKMDDDIAWNVQNVSTFIRNNITSEELYCARLDLAPIRNNASKWYATMEEWSEPMYPPYCSGWCYLAPITVVERLISVAHSQRFFWIDDVFITGVLRKAANVSIAKARLNKDIYYYKGRQSATRAAKYSKRGKIFAKRLSNSSMKYHGKLTYV
ncbi:Hexosyltransferase [Trichostrongylus colubriformis]|uniref:Hexosyltransferase n=1 Tax=Trichostrongylus colubriformis TaxID=6319 RepID=A0AAN8J3R1_TRICO